NAIPRGLAHKTRLQPHSRIGFTFLWRLHSINELAPEARAALLQRVSARAPSGPVRDLIALLGQMHAQRTDAWDPNPFMQRAIDFFGGPPHWKELDHGLNQMAFAFLWPPAPEILSV